MSNVAYTRPRHDRASDAEAATASTSTPGPTRRCSYVRCASADSCGVSLASSHARYVAVTSRRSRGASTGLVRRTDARTSGAPPETAPARRRGEVRAIGGSFSRNACLRVVPFAVCSGWTSVEGKLRRGRERRRAAAQERPRSEVRRYARASFSALPATQTPDRIRARRPRGPAPAPRAERQHEREREARAERCHRRAPTRHAGISPCRAPAPLTAPVRSMRRVVVALVFF